jgi:hypothetical protein
MKIQLFKKEKHFKKKEFVFNTSLYWEIAVFVSFLFVLSFCFFGYSLFVQTNETFFLPDAGATVKIPMVKMDGLEKALNYFSEREKKSYEILNSPSTVVDPSI